MDRGPTRRSTYQKNPTNRFQGTQVEALKDIRCCGKGEYVAIMGESGSGNHPSQRPSHAGPTDGRTGLPQWHRFDHQE